MRWEDRMHGVFEDLEQQAEGLHLADRDAEVADRSLAEYSRVTLADRLHASGGRTLGLEIVGIGRLEGVVRRVGADWMLLQADTGREWVVRFDAVLRAHGASDRALSGQARPVVARLGFGSALRGVAESGDAALLRHVDGTQGQGRLARVGEDFMELEQHGRIELVAFASIAAICRT